jgi:hypothetical protein
MEEPMERRSNRSRKPIVHFDDLIEQSSGLSKPSIAPKALTKPTKPTTKPTAKPTAKPTTKPTIDPKPTLEPKQSTKQSKKASTKASTLDPIEELCTQTEALDIKANVMEKRQGQ